MNPLHGLNNSFYTCSFFYQSYNSNKSSKVKTHLLFMKLVKEKIMDLSIKKTCPAIGLSGLHFSNLKMHYWGRGIG